MSTPACPKCGHPGTPINCPRCHEDYLTHPLHVQAHQGGQRPVVGTAAARSDDIPEAVPRLRSTPAGTGGDAGTLCPVCGHQVAASELIPAEPANDPPGTGGFYCHACQQYGGDLCPICEGAQ